MTFIKPWNNISQLLGTQRLQHCVCHTYSAYGIFLLSFLYFYKINLYSKLLTHCGLQFHKQNICFGSAYEVVQNGCLINIAVVLQSAYSSSKAAPLFLFKIKLKLDAIFYFILYQVMTKQFLRMWRYFYNYHNNFVKSE